MSEHCSLCCWRRWKWPDIFIEPAPPWSMWAPSWHRLWVRPAARDFLFQTSSIPPNRNNSRSFQLARKSWVDIVYKNATLWRNGFGQKKVFIKTLETFLRKIWSLVRHWPNPIDPGRDAIDQKKNWREINISANRSFSSPSVSHFALTFLFISLPSLQSLWSSLVGERVF